MDVRIASSQPGQVQEQLDRRRDVVRRQGPWVWARFGLTLRRTYINEGSNIAYQQTKPGMDF